MNVFNIYFVAARLTAGTLFIPLGAVLLDPISSKYPH